jgi:hypothetical protein
VAGARKGRAAPDAAYETLAALGGALDDERVEVVPKGGKLNLRVGGKVFAFTIRGRLVLKLPPARCAALVDAGRAEWLVMGARTMTEWVTLPLPERVSKPVVALARAALDFVTSASG